MGRECAWGRRGEGASRERAHLCARKRARPRQQLRARHLRSLLPSAFCCCRCVLYARHINLLTAFWPVQAVWFVPRCHWGSGWAGVVLWGFDLQLWVWSEPGGLNSLMLCEEITASTRALLPGPITNWKPNRRLQQTR